MASTIWRGYISFGLISIPVRLFRAGRAERVSLRRLYRPNAGGDDDAEDDATPRKGARQQPTEIMPAFPGNGRNSKETDGAKEEPTPASSAVLRPALAPVQQVSVRKGSDEVLPEGSVVKGYEYEKGRYVALEADDLKSAAPKTSTAMEIEEFVQLEEIDPVYFETSYYVIPEEAGEKAYALLCKAMQATRLVAIAQFAMHSRDHVVVLRPGKTGLLAHTMFFSNEVHADEEYRTSTNLVADKELKLAETLIQSLTAAFEPEKYKDQYRQRLEAIIEKKVKGEPIAVAETASRPAPVVDIADALRKSLANLKKPATSDTRTPHEIDRGPARPKKTARARG